jgi:CRP-like cAMP-binding protein
MLFRGRTSSKVEVLKTVPLFADLSDRHLRLVADQAGEATLQAGTVLTQQGTLGQELILILSGQARVEQDGKSIATLSEGDYLGEISLIDGGPRTATVTAATEMQLLILPAPAFNQLLLSVPEISRTLLFALCRYLRKGVPPHAY